MSPEPYSGGICGVLVVVTLKDIPCDSIQKSYRASDLSIFLQQTQRWNKLQALQTLVA